MPTFIDPLLRRWPVWALIVSAAMLAAAHAFETFGGLAPCTLCLQQRDVYWTAMAVAALALAAAWTPARAWLKPLFAIALIGVFAAGALIAARHAGAEWKWWPGPATCSGGGAHVDAAALANLMHGAKIAAPRCDEAAWRFLGLSMAGWNFLISLGLVALSALAWSQGRADKSRGDG
jgi:disulfide bond formation protein DsbB